MRLYFYLILAVLVASPSIAQTDAEVVKEQVVGGPGPELEPPAVSTEVNIYNLSELEALKGENLLLKYDSIDKQLRLMQAQGAQLQARQAEIVGELQEVQREILKSHGLEGTVDWKEKKIIPATKEVSSEGDPVSEEKE